MLPFIIEVDGKVFFLWWVMSPLTMDFINIQCSSAYIKITTAAPTRLDLNMAIPGLINVRLQTVMPQEAGFLLEFFDNQIWPNTATLIQEYNFVGFSAIKKSANEGSGVSLLSSRTFGLLPSTISGLSSPNVSSPNVSSPNVSSPRPMPSAPPIAQRRATPQPQRPYAPRQTVPRFFNNEREDEEKEDEEVVESVDETQ